MPGWQAVHSIVTSALTSGNRSASFHVLLAVLPLCLFPSVCFCHADLYYQVNTGTVILFDTETSRYWKSGPSLSGEIGCYLGKAVSPSVGFSYTLLTPDWDKLERRTTWALRPTGRRSYILAGTFSLKLTDFEERGILKSYISLGTTLLMQRTDKMEYRGWHSPIDILCQTAEDDPLSVSRSMALLDLGSGLGIGMPGSCAALIQARLSFGLERGFVCLPVEFGLRF